MMLIVILLWVVIALFLFIGHSKNRKKSLRSLSNLIRSRAFLALERLSIQKALISATEKD